jgi:RNA polymerase sigma-70 factor (ECF subfamily)
MAKPDRWGEIEGVYREGYSAFVRVASAITGDRESGVEAVQDGFADALRNAGQWSGRGSLQAWVWRCVINRARKARPRQRSLEVSPPVSNPSGVDSDLLMRLAALPERQRLVVFLRYFADLDYREIAATLDVKVGTVSATLHAAHGSLRSALSEVSG